MWEGGHHWMTAMNLLLAIASAYLVSVIGLTSAAATETELKIPLVSPGAVHAVIVDTPENPTLSHVLPSTWHTLPPPPAPRSGLKGHAPLFFALASELSGD